MEDMKNDFVYQNFIQKFGKIYDFQVQVWRDIKKGNTLLIAPTGYGKTYAAMLPIFSELRNTEKGGVRALYITPLKALNRDIFKQLASFADSVDINMDIRHGDTTAHSKRLQTLMPPDILVTTPETLQGLLSGKIIKEHLRNVKYVIVDEIHELFVSKRGSQLSIALERLNEIADFKRVGISATIGDEEEISKFLVGNGRSVSIVKVGDKKEYDIKIIKPEETKEAKELSREFLISTNVSSTLLKIKEIINSNKKTLIFVNTRETAELLGMRLKKMGINLGVHHSSLSKTKRIEIENEFKSGELNSIVATSSLELGIDIGEIEMVIQYSSPRQATKLVQRIGRAGHKKGIVSNGLLLVRDDEDYLESLAIYQKVKDDWLEKPLMPIKPFDVLSHQILGFIMMEGRNETEILKVVKKSYPFKDLTKKEFDEVIQIMISIGLVYQKDDLLIRTRSGLLQFFNSLSMIPDEKRFIVKDVELNKFVGVLHQGFVVGKCNIGSKIVMQGTVWTITETKGDVIEVIRSSSSEGAIPSWEGELIPISKEVSKGVADLLGKDNKEGANSKRIVIESCDEVIVINSCFGSKINETLSKLFGALISARLGSSINVKATPYRIIFFLPKASKFKIDKELIEELPVEGVEHILRVSTKNSSQYNYQFFRVGRRFGVIAKGAEFTHFFAKRIIDAFKGTLVEEETLNEIFREKMDLEGTKEIISEIKKDKIEVVFKNKLSKESIDSISKVNPSGYIKPEFAYSEIFEIIEKRLKNRTMYLVCTHCKNPIGSFRVENVPEDFSCPYCKAKTIGFLPEKRKSEVKKYIKGGKNESIELSGELFLNYGKKSCYVMSAYGIGPRKAGQILRKNYKNEKELLIEIIKAEKEFIKNKKFWV